MCHKKASKASHWYLMNERAQHNNLSPIVFTECPCDQGWHCCANLTLGCCVNGQRIVTTTQPPTTTTRTNYNKGNQSNTMHTFLLIGIILIGVSCSYCCMFNAWSSTERSLKRKHHCVTCMSISAQRLTSDAPKVAAQKMCRAAIKKMFQQQTPPITSRTVQMYSQTLACKITRKTENKCKKKQIFYYFQQSLSSFAVDGCDAGR